jgi:D-alanyl-D-alanine carboxypeptidase (penicillin-binding protein 5/6)
MSLNFSTGLPRLLMALVTAAMLGLSPAQAAVPQAPTLDAKAYLLVDVTTGQILAQDNSQMPVEPASLTKLMTAYVVFDALKAKKINLDQTFTVSERAWRMEGSRMFIEPNMAIPVRDLLHGMIVQSGNDATVALAEGVAGSVERFVDMMNQQAALLGMKNTAYKNPEGLTAAGHTTTAQDLALLSTRLMNDFPAYTPIYATKHYRYPGTPAANDTNRNLLLFRDPTVDGLKTGHTEAAGYCLVATAIRPVPPRGVEGLRTRRLLSVILGASSATSRATESQKLLNWGYSNFELVTVAKADAALTTARVWKGQTKMAALGVKGGLAVTVPTGSSDKVELKVNVSERLIAPLAAGQVVGDVSVSLPGGVVLTKQPLVAVEAVPADGFLGRMWDTLLLLSE